MFIVTIVQDCDGLDYTPIIEEYRRRGLKLRHLITPENVGPGGARQYGMDNDNMCDYFMFLDADDLLYPRAVEFLYHEAKMHNADVVTSDFEVQEEHGLGGAIKAGSGPVTWTHGKIYRAGYLRDNNIRFLNGLRLNEDSYFNLVAVNCTKNKYIIHALTYLWCNNSNSLTRQDEDRVNYFSRSFPQYILSQVQGLLDIERITGALDSNLVAATLNNMYVQIMEAIYYKLPTDEVKALSLRLKDCAALKACMETKEFWETAHNIVKGSLFKKDIIIFFKMRFCDWINEYILDKKVEE